MIAATIDQVEVSAYTVPTDAPEADGTISSDSTTLVLVRTRSGGVEGIGWTYGPTACATLISDQLAGLVKRRDAMDVTAGARPARSTASRPTSHGVVASPKSCVVLRRHPRPDRRNHHAGCRRARQRPDPASR